MTTSQLRLQFRPVPLTMRLRVEIFPPLCSRHFPVEGKLTLFTTKSLG